MLLQGKGTNLNQTKRKKPNLRKKATGSTAVMKDVCHSVAKSEDNISSTWSYPRGTLCSGFVATAFNVTNELTASEIQDQFGSLFVSKLKGRPFNIVRAVGNKIVEVNLSQEITRKVLKHTCGQGAVYLRCIRPTATEYLWVEDDDSGG